MDPTKELLRSLRVGFKVFAVGLKVQSLAVQFIGQQNSNLSFFMGDVCKALGDSHLPQNSTLLKLESFQEA